MTSETDKEIRVELIKRIIKNRELGHLKDKRIKVVNHEDFQTMFTKTSLEDLKQIAILTEQFNLDDPESKEVQMIVPNDCNIIDWIKKIEKLNPGMEIGTDGNYSDPSGDTYTVIIRPSNG